MILGNISIKLSVLDTIVYSNGEAKFIVYTGRDGYLRFIKTNLVNHEMKK